MQPRSQGPWERGWDKYTVIENRDRGFVSEAIFPKFNQQTNLTGILCFAQNSIRNHERSLLSVLDLGCSHNL